MVRMHITEYYIIPKLTTQLLETLLIVRCQYPAFISVYLYQHNIEVVRVNSMTLFMR